MRAGLTVLILVVLLLLCGAGALWTWYELGDVPISGHGMVALGLGAGLTFLLGAGLMALMFFSSRRGYDDQAHETDRTRPGRWRSPSDEG